MKRLEYLLLLLLAGLAQHVSAEFSCNRDGWSVSGWLEDDARACRKEDLNAVLGAKVDFCSIVGYVSGGFKRVHHVPLSPFSLAESPSPATDTVKIKWWVLVLVQLYHRGKDNCEASAAVINGHNDYDGPAIGCAKVSALLPFGGEIATNWGFSFAEF